VQAWIEASTKGAVLLFTASELEYYSLRANFNPFMAGIIGGMGGGVAQAYATVLPPTLLCSGLIRIDGILHNHENRRNHTSESECVG